MSSNKYAPIALFVYKRPDHLVKTIYSLKKNYLSNKSRLIIFSDSYKNDKDYKKVKSVRKIIKEISGFYKIEIVERKNNFGLSRNILEGINDVISAYKKIIVLEEDLVTSPFFLNYINHGLDIYKDNPKVASIHGYCYPIKFQKKIIEDTFFLKGADCWGWGTWKESWNKFVKDPDILINNILKKKLVKKFNFDDSFAYFQMLINNSKKLNDSWAIRWYASAFLNNMYTLYPRISLVKNIGNDGSGYHFNSIDNKKDIFKTDLFTDYKKFNKIKIRQNIYAYNMFKNFFISNFKKSFLRNVLDKLKVYNI